MKFLFVASNLKQIGGAERHVLGIINVLKEKAKIDIVELRNATFFSKLVFCFKIVLAVLTRKPDIIVCAHVNFSPIAYFLKFIFRKKYLIIVYGTDVWYKLNALKTKALAGASMVLPMSNYTAKKLLENAPELKEKIFILPGTVDGYKFLIKGKTQELLNKYNLFGKKILLTVTRLSAEEQMKGYDKIIMGLPKVIKAVPEVRYLLVGSGTDLPRIEKLVKELKLEDYVIMPGSIPLGSPLLVDYYNICDLYVMPSVSEGFGIVFLEALACGKPVIAGNLDASPETLLYGKLGFLVNPNDVDEISETIIKVLNKQVPAYLLDGDYLRNKTLDSYGPEKFREKITALLNILVKY